MPQKNRAVATITIDAYQKVHSHFLRNLKLGQIEEDKSFSRYITDIITEEVEEDECLSKVTPLMQKVFFENNCLLIRDNKLGRIAELKIRGREIVCLYCNRKDCRHVGFSYAIPEIYRFFSLQKLDRG